MSGCAINRVIAAVLLVAMTAAVVGCRSGGTKRPSPMSDELITQIIESHNERVGSIDRLWARVSVRIKGTDARGGGFEEQGEGHLQVTRPDQVSLTIGKLGETYFAYGSNNDRYWMFDLSDSDRRIALVGAIENLTPNRADEIGLSVHPGDLISSLGIEPIDPERIVATRWDEESARIVISVPSRWGVTEYWFDPDRGLPGLVRSLDEQGELIADSELSRYKGLLGDQRRASGVLVPGKVEISRGGAGAKNGDFVRIELSEPSQRAIKGMVYNPDRLVRAYRIHEIVDLDATDP